MAREEASGTEQTVNLSFGEEKHHFSKGELMYRVSIVYSTL